MNELPWNVTGVQKVRKEHCRKKENENRKLKESRCTYRCQLPAVKFPILDAYGSWTSSGGGDELRLHEREDYQ